MLFQQAQPPLRFDFEIVFGQRPEQQVEFNSIVEIECGVHYRERLP
jgi:hypothetical protein